MKAVIVSTIYAMIVLPALAAPPEGADPKLEAWFRSLHAPFNGTPCCDIADCRNYPVRSDGHHYQVLYNSSWLPVPDEVVSPRTDNPTGDYVTCIHHPWDGKKYGPPLVLCLFKAPRT